MTAPKRKAGGPRGKTLTDQQRRFADLVLAGVPAGRAYERAGYTAKNAAIADSSASRLTRHARVAEYLASGRKKATSSAIASREERLAILTDIVRSEVGHRDAESSTVAQRKDVVAAAKLIAQMQGELVERRETKNEHSGPGGGPIETSAVPRTREEALARIEELRRRLEQVDA